MASKSDTSATLFAQKKLLGKAHTSNLKIDGEEVIGSNIQTSTNLIFGEKIPNAPSQTLYVAQGAPGTNPATGQPYPTTVEYIQFVLTAITGTTYDANVSGGGSGTDAADLTQIAGPHAYKFTLPSNYQSLTSNPKAGNGVFDNNKLVHETLGQLQLIPPFYSQTAPNPYIVKLYKDNGSGNIGDEIPLLDNVDWNIDSYNGVLFLQDYSASKIPAFAQAFAYIGKMAQEVIESGSLGGGSGADGNASYLLLSSTGSLGSARVFTAGAGIDVDDSGAGNNYTVSIDDSVVATLSGSIFSGVTKHNAGLSGSLTRLTDGRSYLVAGNNITIASESNGSVTINAIVDDDFFNSTTAAAIFTTGSVAFRGTDSSIDAPSDVGANVFFFVSGSKGSLGTTGANDSVFGGNLVVSGTLKIGTGLEIASIPSVITYLDAKNFLNIAAGGGGVDINDGGGVRLLTPITKIGASFFGVDVGSDANLFVSGTLTGRGTSQGKISVFGGQLVSSGTIHALGGLSGSLTRLIDGTSYLVAGSGINVSSGSNGSITLSLSSVGASTVAGSDTQIQFNDGGVFGADNGLTYDKLANSLFISGSLLVNKTTPAYGEILSINQILTSSSDFVRAGAYIKQTLTGSNNLPAGDSSLLYSLLTELYNKSKLAPGYGITAHQSYAYHQSTSSISHVWGYLGGAAAIKPEDGNTAGNIGEMIGLSAGAGYSAATNFTGSITDAIGVQYNNFGINAARTVTNSYGIQLLNVGSPTGVTNAIGLDIAKINTASGIKLGIRTQDPIVVGASDVVSSEMLRVSGSSYFEAGSARFTAGLSGSLTQLTDGTSYLIAGSGIGIVTGSKGQITVSQNIEWNENLVGAIDGINTNFTLTYLPSNANSIMVFLNGILLEQGVENDFTIFGTTVSLIEPPLPDSKVTATYSR